MIHVKDLNYKYSYKENFAIYNINFSIKRGEIFGFLGPSGAGKSTTQKILYKHLREYTGSVVIDNKNLSEWGKELYQKIGVSFELSNHYLKLTALENLEFFRGFYPKEKTIPPIELLEKVGLKDKANKMVGEFSKGMKVRLNFIRAILHNPDIIFFDEPTSGLDPVNARILKDIIRELQHKGKTIFITTHQMYDADELCNRIAFIVDGEIKAIDSPQNLKIKHAVDSVEVVLKNTDQKKTFPLIGLGKNKNFLNLIANQEIETIHSTEPTLEDIFIKITGKELLQ